MGPLPFNGGDDDLLHSINKFTQLHTTCGGSWGACRQRLTPASGRKGTVRTLRCSGYERTLCKWNLSYERAHEGWVFSNATLEHNGHELAQSKAAAMASASTRGLPPFLAPLGELLSEAHLSSTMIDQVFKCAAQREEFSCSWSEPFEVSWNKQDLHYRFVRKSSSPRSNDPTGFLEFLLSRERETTLPFEAHTESHGTETFFVVLKGGKEEYRRSGKGNVLVLDTTFNTNRCGLLLSMFITKGSFGEVALIAYLVHRAEDFEEIFWGLRCFHAHFPVPPATVLTDSGAGWLSALDKFNMPGMPWHFTKLLLCIFHLDINFVKHISPLFRGSASGWLEVHNMFWRLAKDSDSTLQSTVIQDIDRMIGYVREHGKGTLKSMELALNWMTGTLKEIARKWVACITWASFTALMHSTQLAESNHASLKSLRQNNNSLIELHAAIENKDEERSFTKAVEEVRLQWKNTAGSNTPPLFITSMQGIITGYAYDLLLAQFGQCMLYTYTPVPSDLLPYSIMNPPNSHFYVSRSGDLTRNSIEHHNNGSTSNSSTADIGIGDEHRSRITSIESCSCQLLTSGGIPCRHIICLIIRLDPHHACFSSMRKFKELFHTKWLKELQAAQPPAADGGDCSECDDDEDDAHTPCFLSMRSMLYKGFEIDALGTAELREVLYLPADDTNGGTMHQSAFGKTILIKWGTVRQGAWHLATIEKYEPKAGHSFSFVPNCCLTFPYTDSQTVAMRLTTDAYLPMHVPSSFQKLPKYSWCLTKAASLSDFVPGKRLPGPSDRSKGRPPSKRFKPAWGLTS